jgi:hypothetical protein
MQDALQLVDKPENVISLSEAARILGVVHSTAWAWALRGKLPSQNVAGRFLVRRQDAEMLKLRLAEERCQ